MLRKIRHFKYLPLLLILSVAIVFLLLKATSPKAKRRAPPPPKALSIEVIEIQPQDVPIIIQSYGIVKPRVQSQLIAQVSGRVTSLSEKFRDGGFFRKGDILLQIDDADYRADVAIAKANVARSENDYQQEVAQSEQAKQDWIRLNGNISPPLLVSRSPQLAAAKATRQSAKAQQLKAELNYRRTQIKAPFDGRVLTKNVDLGQVLNQNNNIGEIYATDAIEITLPIKNTELPFIDLPEDHHQSEQAKPQPIVSVNSSLFPQEHWKGKIVRTASFIDDATRQLSVTARIDDPYGKKAFNRKPLKIGEYVTASITGKVLHKAISIPNKAIYQGSYVYIFSDDAVHRQAIDIAWQNKTHAIIRSGLKAADSLVITSLGQITSGTRATVINSLTNAPKTSTKNKPKKVPPHTNNPELDETLHPRQGQSRGVSP